MQRAAPSGKELSIGQSLSEKQIGFPLVVNHAAKILDKSHMSWLSRRSRQLHPYFLGRSVALFVITSYTRTDEILPCIATTPRFRHNMIYRQRRFCSTAILATAAIATDNIAPG